MVSAELSGGYWLEGEPGACRQCGTGQASGVALYGFRRQRIRWERHAGTHPALLESARRPIIHRQLGAGRYDLSGGGNNPAATK